MIRTEFNLLTAPPSNERPTVAVDFEGTLSNSQLFGGLLRYIRDVQGNKKFVRKFKLTRLHYYPIVKLELPNARKYKSQAMIDVLRSWRDMPREKFQDVVDYNVEKLLLPNLRKSVVAELKAHLDRGMRVVIISGMPEPFLKRVLQTLPGFEAIGTPLEYQDGRFTGELGGPFNVEGVKVDNLQPFLQDGKLAAAYGDTIEDIAMLSLAKDPVAVAPDNRLRKAAEQASWRIIED